MAAAASSRPVVLVDTSVWIELFRKPGRFRLEDEVDLDDVATCLPVIQEVLQGFREEQAFRLARASMFAFPVTEAPLRPEVFELAVDLFRTARRAGITVRSSVDCLVAACAIRRSLTVLHHDRDYDALARIAPLQAKRIRIAS